MSKKLFILFLCLMPILVFSQKQKKELPSISKCRKWKDITTKGSLESIYKVSFLPNSISLYSGTHHPEKHILNQLGVIKTEIDERIKSIVKGKINNSSFVKTYNPDVKPNQISQIIGGIHHNSFSTSNYPYNIISKSNERFQAVIGVHANLMKGNRNVIYVLILFNQDKKEAVYYKQVKVNCDIRNAEYHKSIVEELLSDIINKN